MNRNKSRRRSSTSEPSLFKKNVNSSIRQQDLSDLYSRPIQKLLKLDNEFKRKHDSVPNSDYARIMNRSNQSILDRVVYDEKFKNSTLKRIDSYAKTAHVINFQKRQVLMDYMEKNHPDSLLKNGCVDVKYKNIESLSPDEKLIFELSKRSINKHNNHTGDNLKKYITSTNLHDTIYISIDLEEYEFTHKITEVGITIYDPRENGSYFMNGDYCTNQMPTFRKYHVIIEEEIDSRNSVHILCKKPESLFNETYILTKRETNKFLQSIWDRYFNNDNIARNGFKCALVGQSVGGDIKELTRQFNIKSFCEFDYDLTLGKVLENKPRKILVYDTEKISMTFLFNAVSVKKQLRFLNIPHGSLHNALNDAYFTLISFLTMTNIESRINLKLDDPMELLKKCTLLNMIRVHPEKVLPVEVLYNIEESEHKRKSSKKMAKNTEQLEYGLPLNTTNYLDLLDF